ncbi:FliI/YscN family ATPase [Escherichia coli]|nr:FliI/YscN family ATPase [Escherichia coli]EFD4960401.1 FliI/YscN family ATPase [Escherichia coli]
MKQIRFLTPLSYPNKISGPILEARLQDISIGEICNIRASIDSNEVIARAQVVGFHDEKTILSLIGNSRGLSRRTLIKPTAHFLHSQVGHGLLGAVVNPLGEVTDRFLCTDYKEILHRPVDASPPLYNERAVIEDQFSSGVKVIDSLLTCGEGQRMGIFASAGCGKTFLMNMLIEHSDADICVIGLIGERGREVTEIVDYLRNSPKGNKCVLVYATSDYSSVDRCNAAYISTTIAEFFRSEGYKVALFIDSLTRYARALRDVALAAGEAPARRGYPVSVFDSLPRLLERPGKLKSGGSITAFYTVLMEDEDFADPLAEEVRSILDGHIYLSRNLAQKGHFPAIDPLKSISRVFNQVVSAEHREIASKFRLLLNEIEELKTIIDFGEYKPGENARQDYVYNKIAEVDKFLKQDYQIGFSYDQTMELINEALR